MRTTLNVDAELLDALMGLSKATSKSDAVNQAIAEYVRRRKLERLKQLSGELRLDENWDDLRRLEQAESP
ncbi:MAG: type II toxin-antitoxin system VapB family antitoxin [Salinibacter sp.]